MGEEAGRAAEIGRDRQNGVRHPVRRLIVEVLERRNGAGVRYLALMLDQHADEGDLADLPRGYLGKRKSLEDTHIPRLVADGIVRYSEETEWVELVTTRSADSEAADD